MKITIENCSSAGAHFSDNTNDVMVKIHKWIKENKYPKLRFIEFRRRAASEKSFNDNNARNIYPLLKNCGFVEYQAGGELDTSKFFTSNGEAYVLALESLQMIEQADYSNAQKEAAFSEMNKILHSLIYDGVNALFKNPELNYRESMKWFLAFLLEFDKIDKNEFAYMVYQMSQDEENWADKIRDVINGYRNKEIEIDVQVCVRNDQKIQVRTGQTTRLEDITFFTAYSFYSALFLQAGITRKANGYHHLIPEMKNKVEELLEV